MATYSIIMTTCGSQEEAEQIARSLLAQKLAAFVQVISVKSFGIWEGETTRDSERLLLIRTRSSFYAAVQEAITAQHSYETPEVIEIPITQGLPAYLGWIDGLTDESQSGSNPSVGTTE